MPPFSVVEDFDVIKQALDRFCPAPGPFVVYPLALEPAQLLTWHLEPAFAGEGIARVIGQLLLPATKDAVLDTEIPRGLGDALSLLGNQTHGLQLEFPDRALSAFR